METIDTVAADPVDTLIPEVIERVTDIEREFADVLAGVVGAERVSADSHFFDDLGADSLVMARFCARVRKRPELPPVSMKDIYRHPTIAGLAAALAEEPPAPAAPPAVHPVEVMTSMPSKDLRAPVGTGGYVLCAALQLLFYLGYTVLSAVVMTRVFEWISAGSGVFEVYLRSVLAGGAGFVAVCAFPIAVKWLLVGRWRPQQIRVWSLGYVRFWIVRTLIRSNPLVLFAGSPLYVLYLRALGARIGRGVTIFAKTVPVCTDLLSIGDGTIIRKDVVIPGYRADAGLIETGAVTLGTNVVVSEATVLDIETSMGDGAQLGHASSLHPGQAVPAGERWHGSPGVRADVDYRAVEPADCGTLRRVRYTVLQLLGVFLVSVPLAIGGIDVLLTAIPQATVLLNPGRLNPLHWSFYLGALAFSAAVFFGAVLIGLLAVATVPRILHRAITPGRVYPLYGVHYAVHRAIARLTNIKFFTTVFGDSSYIVGYLRRIGYDLSVVEQTGSNFGTEVKHETPYLTTVGSGTMVADGLSVANADFSSTSFRVSRASIGPRNFLGNRILYPAQGKTGDNCLLATKVMVPIDGPVREGVGLLGSPSFEIPRSVERDSSFDHLSTGAELRRRLRAKNRYNLRTIGVFLLVRWLHVVGLTLLAMGGWDLYERIGALAVPAELLLGVLFTTTFFVLAERSVARFRPLRPRFCSIYDRYFWGHERFWKLVLPDYLDKRFSGTPFKNVVSRLLGVRLGRRVFDDGCFIPEKTLTAIGDDCTLNAGSVIQCHSQEDGTFKSDRTAIGARCTLGTGAFVHYGVTMHDDAALAPDSFLMKGEDIPRHARWGGNPARPMGDHRRPQTSTATTVRGGNI